jgi:hypothetical protein
VQDTPQVPFAMSVALQGTTLSIISPEEASKQVSPFPSHVFPGAIVRLPGTISVSLTSLAVQLGLFRLPASAMQPSRTAGWWSAEAVKTPKIRSIDRDKIQHRVIVLVRIFSSFSLIFNYLRLETFRSLLHKVLIQCFIRCKTYLNLSFALSPLPGLIPPHLPKASRESAPIKIISITSSDTLPFINLLRNS